MKVGKRPTAHGFLRHRHLPAAWKPSDKKRAALADQRMIKAACIYIKGDWCEYACTLGYAFFSLFSRECLATFLCAFVPHTTNRDDGPFMSMAPRLPMA